MSEKMKINFCGVDFHSPVTVASGTYGFGREYGEYVDLNHLGGISVKGLTLKEKLGNPGQRMAETPMGMINSVGLQNPGVDHFVREEIPFLRQFGSKIIANINGSNIDEYVEMARILSNEDVDIIELNISCPNVKDGGMAFGTNPKMVEKVVREVRKVCKKPLIVKLTPNVTDIVEIAKIVEAEGADGISLINTLSGMAIDIYSQKPVLERKYGGLSGPAIKPVALKLVHQVASNTNLPILGMGGIAKWEDAVEFILAGASLVAVGTQNFVDPYATIKIHEGIEAYMDQMGIAKLEDMVGLVK